MCFSFVYQGTYITKLNILNTNLNSDDQYNLMANSYEHEWTIVLKNQSTKEHSTLQLLS